ncbi:peptide/nickel transport system permease protein [Paenibacillus tianmuensis]|uniref:Peptide/nickel transport system permease protein n=1 Tax=Paenibacillus tianmuensis TaxID=624147 RepID=A0A1G4RI62_9BACL|nr:ABC transporter permease [Paenibacillus tianmuensis]SCW56195.1 peptide/nickel transport system permease protein [Paenibacillus tianmuensis]
MKTNQLTKHEAHFRLASCPEYSQAGFSGIASLGIALVLLLNSYDWSGAVWKPAVLAAFAAYLVFGLLQLAVRFLIKRDLLRSGELRQVTRRLGYVLLLSLLTANIFVGTAALQLIKRKKSVAYTLAFYALLTTLSVFAVSALNVFKPYVANTFLPGMALLIVAAVVQLVALLLVARYAEDKIFPKSMWIVAIALLATTATGNLFALFLGLLLIAKLRDKEHMSDSKLNHAVERLSRSSASMLGLFFICFLLTIAVCSYLMFDYGMAIDNNYGAILQSPSLAYPLGTDNFGRDLFSRIVFGARISLFVGFLSTLIPVVIGGLLGAISGYFGRQTDNVIMRALDVLYAIPGILLAIAIIAAFGANTTNLILALSVGAIPAYARTMRANVMLVSTLEYVQAARAFGSSDLLILFKHIIPNSISPMIVKSTLTIGTAVISTSSLSFLGLGVEPHIPEWGNILKVGSAYLESHAFTAIYPGLAIIALVLSFNFLGDGVRDALDPKLK